MATRSSKIILATLFVLLMGPPAVAAGTPPSAARYAQLVAKAERGDADTDYTALRLSYAVSADYDPYGGISQPLMQDAWKAVQAKDCKTALAKTDELVKHDFTSVDGHFMRAECFKETGDAKSAERETAIGRGLADSIMNSGDGKSEQTAFVVVTLREEYFVMGGLQVKETQQALINGKNGHPYDLLSGKMPDGSDIGLYFDISRLMAEMNRELKK